MTPLLFIFESVSLEAEFFEVVRGSKREIQDFEICIKVKPCESQGFTMKQEKCFSKVILLNAKRWM